MIRQLSKRLELDYSNILLAIFELMLTGGVRTRELLPICMRAVKRAELQSRANRKNRDGGLIAAALVLDAWHRDRRYLTTQGTPKPVPLRGPAPSVEALIRVQKVEQGVTAVSKSLKTFRLIAACGKGLYKPASDVAVIATKDPLIAQHAARALSALLDTVGKNVSGRRKLPRLIERVAEVPDLPRKDIPAFQAFTQAQGRAFLRTVNDWLESRRARSAKRRLHGTVRAGVHAYAYVRPSR